MEKINAMKIRCEEMKKLIQQNEEELQQLRYRSAKEKEYTSENGIIKKCGIDILPIRYLYR